MADLKKVIYFGVNKKYNKLSFICIGSETFAQIRPKLMSILDNPNFYLLIEKK